MKNKQENLFNHFVGEVSYRGDNYKEVVIAVNSTSVLFTCIETGKTLYQPLYSSSDHTVAYNDYKKIMCYELPRLYRLEYVINGYRQNKAFYAVEDALSAFTALTESESK